MNFSSLRHFRNEA